MSVVLRWSVSLRVRYGRFTVILIPVYAYYCYHTFAIISQRGGIYGPGPRFILELRPFLSEMFKEEIHDCHLCKDPVIRVRNRVIFGIY